MVETLSIARLRRLWLHAQRLSGPPSFGSGPEAVHRAIRQLGYVQIDTINVIERCHHHILFNRIPDYRRGDLEAAQSRDKTVFEYWTHALAYIPSEDIRYFVPAMRAYAKKPDSWYDVGPRERAKVLKRLREEGPFSVRDVTDDTLVDKNHPWASRKPSKRALQRLFYEGVVTVSARQGMLKTYDLTARHFGWNGAPRPATERQILDYRLDRALAAQSVVSLDSICYLEPSAKKAVRETVERRLRRRALRPVAVEGFETIEHFVSPEDLASEPPEPEAVHILSPFDPMTIQRKRTAMAFGHDHRFEAYVPAPKRVYGYFALPVVVGDEMVALLDLKTDRAAGVLRIQAWHWLAPGDPARHTAPIEAALHDFERFQLQAENRTGGAEAPPVDDP